MDLRVANDGSLLYLARDANQVFRVTFTGSQAPAITQQPQNSTVSTGTNATFTVTASGTAPLSYQWQRLNGTTWTNLANGSGVSGATTATLTLTAVDAADAGQYRAIVTNSAGSVTSNAATLTVTTNQAPSGTITINSGLTGGRFIAGQPIILGNRNRSRRWHSRSVGVHMAGRLHHQYRIGQPGGRPFVPAFGGQTSGTFTPATTGPYTLTDVAYRITLTVRDSGGLTTTRTTRRVTKRGQHHPPDHPCGWHSHDRRSAHPRRNRDPSVVGFQRPIGAAATQTIGGFTYTFQSWSDGGAATHTISTPTVNTAYTATYLFATRINFQPSGASVPTGYLADTGAVFANRGNGYSFGWNANNASTARDRNAANSPDQRFDTLQHLQKPENPNAVWELAVPNGQYRVRVVSGDPSHIDSVFRTNVEGLLTINATPTSSTRWFDNTVTVTVTDGRLTISNATGAEQQNQFRRGNGSVGGCRPSLPAGLVGEFRFNEGSGTTTADGSPSSNNATLIGGATFAAGHSGSGVSFDGLTGRAELSSDISPTLGGFGTVAFWMMSTQTGNNTMWQAPGILGVESAGDGNDVFWGWLDATGRIGIQAGNTAGAKSANPINDGQWHHVALTRDAATGAVQVYVDGALSGSATSEAGVKTTAFSNIGRIDDTGGTPTHLVGALDDVLIFNRVLNVDEIHSLM